MAGGAQMILSLVAAFAVMGLVGNWDAAMCWMDRHQGVAGFAQFLGGIGAVIAAFRVGNAQTRTALELQDHAEAASRAAAIVQTHAVLDAMANETEHLFNNVRQIKVGQSLNLNVDPLTENLLAIQHMLTHRLPAECVLSLMEMRNAMHALTRFAKSNNGVHVYGNPKAKDITDRVEAQIAEAVDRLKKLL